MSKAIDKKLEFGLISVFPLSETISRVVLTKETDSKFMKQLEEEGCTARISIRNK